MSSTRAVVVDHAAEILDRVGKSPNEAGRIDQRNRVVVGDTAEIGRRMHSGLGLGLVHHCVGKTMLGQDL